MEFADQICFTETSKSLKANYSSMGRVWHSYLPFLREITIQPNLVLEGFFFFLFVSPKAWPSQHGFREHFAELDPVANGVLMCLVPLAPH